MSHITINVYEDPPTPSVIAAARTAAKHGDDREDTALKVFMFCPIPVVDAVAAAATYGLMSALRDDPMAPFLDVPEALALDWGGSEATAAYVDKVRQQGRHLIQIEVAALKDHLATVNRVAEIAGQAQYVMNLAVELAKKAGVALTSSK